MMKRRSLLGTASGLAVSSLLPVSAFGAAEIQMRDIEGNSKSLDAKSITAFAEELDGTVFRPGSREYEMSRQVWNAVWDRHPALIVKCLSQRDIVSAVNFARDENLLTAVKCGGHSMSGKGVCDGGVVIDVSALNDVRIDLSSKTAVVSGGALLGDLDRKAIPFGLATTAGVVSHTGAGGLILGGGMGRLQRKFGLSIDNLQGVEIVSADGVLRTANETENSDLFWAVRGGGGNFGVVTAFTLQLHPFDPIVTDFSIMFPLARDLPDFLHQS